MSATDSTHVDPELSFDTLNWVATDPLARDREQSHRLHEPEKIVSTIDPITGNKIENTEGHPYIIDGNVVIYFESEATRKTFEDLPVDHPFKLQDNPTEEGEAEG
jgi:YHS domain-containing protein